MYKLKYARFFPVRTDRWCLLTRRALSPSPPREPLSLGGAVTEFESEPERQVLTDVGVDQSQSSVRR